MLHVALARSSPSEERSLLVVLALVFCDIDVLEFFIVDGGALS